MIVCATPPRTLYAGDLVWRRSARGLAARARLLEVPGSAQRARGGVAGTGAGPGGAPEETIPADAALRQIQDGPCVPGVRTEGSASGDS